MLGGNEVSLPQLPLPCIHSSATRVYFGHERRLAEGNVLEPTPLSLSSKVYKTLWEVVQGTPIDISAAERYYLPGDFVQCGINDNVTVTHTTHMLPL